MGTSMYREQNGVSDVKQEPVTVTQAVKSTTTRRYH